MSKSMTTGFGLLAALSALALATPLAGFCKPTDAAVRSNLVRPRTVLKIGAKEGNPRNGEGDFLRLKDGRILLVYTEWSGDSQHDEAPAHLVKRVSSDNGETWTEPVEFVPRSGRQNDMSVSLVRLDDGRIALFYARKNSERDCMPVVRFSADEGETWSELKDCLPEKERGYYVLNNARVEKLKSGRLLVPLCRHAFLDGKFQGRGRFSIVWSDDAGKTWTHGPEYEPKDEKGEYVTVQEPGVIQLKDGRVYLYLRTNRGCQWQAYSSDEGKTWKDFGPSPIKSPMAPATIRRLSSGDLLLVWNDWELFPGCAKTACWGRAPLSMAVSKDEGRTWRDHVLLTADMSGFSCYYAVLELKDEILLHTYDELGLKGSSVLKVPKAKVGSNADYSVAILGDTHYDAASDATYHSHYKNEGKPEWLWKVQRQEFARNGEMWSTRCPKMLAASAKIAHEKPTDFVLQLGDVIQGDCDDAATHKKMLDDCIRMLRAPYPKDLPFLTVVGNHDFRGENAWDAYFEFAETFLSKELGKEVRYPAFAFRHGPDAWIFCHFESAELTDIARLIEENADARHIFLVTHGPFTPGESTSWTWRLGGDARAGIFYRPGFLQTLLRHRVIVLSGHTHQISCWRLANELGSYSEFTVNSVWAKPEQATAEPLASKPEEYGECTVRALKEKKNDSKARDYERDIAPFKKDLKDYFYNQGAGHFRLNVGETKVTMDFYPGDAATPARTFVLKD